MSPLMKEVDRVDGNVVAVLSMDQGGRVTVKASVFTAPSQACLPGHPTGCRAGGDAASNCPGAVAG